MQERRGLLFEETVVALGFHMGDRFDLSVRQEVGREEGDLGQVNGYRDADVRCIFIKCGDVDDVAIADHRIHDSLGFHHRFVGRRAWNDGMPSRKVGGILREVAYHVHPGEFHAGQDHDDQQIGDDGKLDS